MNFALLSQYKDVMKTHTYHTKASPLWQCVSKIFVESHFLLRDILVVWCRKINFERASHQCSFQCAWTNISVPVSHIGIRFYRHLGASMEPPLWWQPPRMVLSLAPPRGGRGSLAATHNNNSKYAWSVVKHAWKLGLLLTCSVIYSVDGLAVISSLVSYFWGGVACPL